MDSGYIHGSELDLSKVDPSKLSTARLRFNEKPIFRPLIACDGKTYTIEEVQQIIRAHEAAITP